MTYSHDSLMEMLRDWADTARKADTILKEVSTPQPGRDGIPADEFDRWLAAHDAEVREQALAPIREALAGHPRCDIHPDGDPITCGWKRAVASVQATLDKEDR